MKEITLTIKTLNNKSRKGDYVYIRTKGTRGAYYKYDDNVPLDIYKDYYVDRYVEKETKGTIKQYKTAWEIAGQKIRKEKPTKKITKIEPYIQKLRKTRKIKHLFKKGITKTTITNIHNATTHHVRNQIKKLLKPLVLDQRLVDVLATNENMKKIKDRLEHHIRIKNPQGKIIGTTNTIGIKTTEQVINDLKNIAKIGTKIHSDKPYTTDLDIKLEKHGYTNIKLEEDGEIGNIDIQIILRRGK